ncbi:MAG: MFS transporter [Desulfobacteraceae bacterium]|jgi:DHA1 family bicyclomycin/chloramphenicol resistance-like MFS transporter
MPLSKKQMLPLLALLTAFPALSTDMYLPALPSLAEQWQQPLSAINLTLSAFFFIYGLFLLVYGPLSDRYGRKPVLIAGLLIYLIGSLLCVVAFGAVSLIAFRVIQAAGASSASAISLAICKDLFEGEERVRVLAHIALIMTAVPMLGPIVGGVVLTYSAWPVVFVFQAGLGLIALAGGLKAPETLGSPDTISLKIIFKNYYLLLTNCRFITYTGLMAGIAFPLFAFIGGSSDFYISFFGLSEKSFGYFFALNAVAMMLGFLVCKGLLRRMESPRIITIGYSGVLIGSWAVYCWGAKSPWHLALCMCYTSFMLVISRPTDRNLLFVCPSMAQTT